MISQQYLNIFSCSDLLPLLIIQNIIVFIILFLFLAIWCLIKDVIEKPPCTLFNRSITVHEYLHDILENDIGVIPRIFQVILASEYVNIYF